jgi:arginase
MRIAVIQVPYHLGREGVGMGRGPIRFVEAGLAEELRERGHTVGVETVKVEPALENDLSAVIRVNARLSDLVKVSMFEGRFPLVLAGNCSTCLGVLAGLSSARTGIIWFDAHGDFNTPETSPSGFLDGMALAMAAGRCYQDLWKEIGGGGPVPESNIVLVGARDLDDEERESLERSNIAVVPAQMIRKGGVSGSFPATLERLRSRLDELYLHFDIDVLDPSEAPGVDFRCESGLFLDEIERVLETVSQHFRITAMNIASYNPDLDGNDVTLMSGLRLLTTLAGLISRW